MYKHITTILLAGTIVFSALSVSTPSHAAKAIDKHVNVIVDQAKVYRIPRPAATVIIGNPGIVDAIVEDDQTLVLTGKSFGVTNLIILDDKGEAIVDKQVTVKGQEINTVRIYRGGDNRETLACAPSAACESTLTIGDSSAQFSSSQSQISARNSLSAGN